MFGGWDAAYTPRLYVDLPLDMDFIFDHALLSVVGIPRDTAPRAVSRP
jgi:hypothetical protein